MDDRINRVIALLNEIEHALHEVKLLVPEYYENDFYLKFLTKTQNKILGCLYRSRALVRFDLLESVLHNSSDDVKSHALLNVHVHHLRKKLKPYGVRIDLVRGVGYEIGNGGRDIISRLIEKQSENI